MKITYKIRIISNNKFKKITKLVKIYQNQIKMKNLNKNKIHKKNNKLIKINLILKIQSKLNKMIYKIIFLIILCKIIKNQKTIIKIKKNKANKHCHNNNFLKMTKISKI